MLDPWQRDVLDGALGFRRDGTWAAFEVAEVLPRQNGKGAILEARQLAGLFLFGERLQVHSAHEFKTCVEHFLRVKNLIEGCDDLARKVRIIRTGAGDQGVELRSGARIRFLARSRSSGRGFSGDTVYLDEAFELPVQAMGALLPTLSARPNPQIWYASSAPHFTSDFLHSLLRRAGHSDEERLYLAAWENPAGIQLDDVNAWRRANPAIGYRIDEEFIANELRALRSTPEGISEFARERLGIREGGDGEAGVIPYDVWAQIVDVGSQIVSSRCFGLSVSPDGTWASFSAAGRRADQLGHIETIDRREGTGWVVARAVELYGRWKTPIRVNPAAAEGALIKPLREARVEVVEVAGREYSHACGAVLEAVKNRTLRHLDQETMNRSASAAGKRESGDAKSQEKLWMWARPGSVDITPLTAVTLAWTGVTEAKVDVTANVW